MPRKPDWIHRLDSITEHLRTGPDEILDRAAIEVLFAVKPRQATRILRRFGARTRGGALLISKSELMAAVDSTVRGEAVQFEQRRRRKLGAWLQQARREAGARQIPIPEVPGVPEGIHLEPGRLEIQFADAQELLQKMMHLAKVAAEDWHRFQERTR